MADVKLPCEFVERNLNVISHHSVNNEYTMPHTVPKRGMKTQTGKGRDGINQLRERIATPAHTRITPAQRTGGIFSRRKNLAPNAPET
jgi:hypothetical protein